MTGARDVWLLVGGLFGEGLTARAAFCRQQDAEAMRDAVIAHDKAAPVFPGLRVPEHERNAFHDARDRWQQTHPLGEPNIVLDKWDVQRISVRAAGPALSSPGVPRPDPPTMSDRCCEAFERLADCGDVSQNNDGAWRLMFAGTPPQIRFCPFCGSSVTPLNPYPMLVDVVSPPRVERAPSARPAPSYSPEHDKRESDDEPMHPELYAAFEYVDSAGMKTRLPGGAGPQTHLGYLWHGWAIREAFLAGISWRDANPKT